MQNEDWTEIKQTERLNENKNYKNFKTVIHPFNTDIMTNPQNTLCALSVDHHMQH